MTLPPISGDATLNNAPFRKAVGEMHRDLLTLLDVSKKLGTIKITADLSGAKDAQRATRAVRDAVQEMVPSDMQRRIDSMFGGFDVGVSSATRSAQVFQAQAAALRARINELSNGVRLVRAEFQTGLGEATPEEIEALSTRMRALQTELEKVGQEAKENFGEFSSEALKAGMAARTAVATVEAANGRMPRLGLASTVKLGTSQALSEYGGQLGGMTNNLLGLAKGFEQSRIQSVMFEKTLQENGEEVAKVRGELEQLAVRYNALPQDMEATYKALRRSGYEADQAREAIELYAAIATVRGKDVGQAMEALSTDVERSSTILSNALGISTDQIASQEKYAKSLGKTRDELTGAQKAQAFLNALTREEGDALTEASAALEGYGGAAGQLAKESRDAQKAIGEALLPTVTLGTRVLTGFLDFFNAAPEPVKVLTGLLLASAAAIGVLSVPVASIATLYGTLTASAGTAAAAETAVAAATTRTNVAMTLKRVLLMDVGTLYAKANATAMAYSGSLGVAAGATNVLTGSVTALGTAMKGLIAGTSIVTVAAAAVGALGLYWADSVKKTTQVYEQVDEANQAAFEKTMKRVEELRKQGTDLSRAQAKYLLITDSLARAEAGTPTGKVNWITGEREIKRDEQAIARLRAEQEKARQSMVYYYTEAQRRGQLNLKLTEDQTKAVSELKKTLEGRQFDLKVGGMTELGADLARLQKEFDGLRQEFKKPFVVKGKLMDPKQTPALREGLDNLDAQLLAEQAALRKRYADEAVKVARESALSAQAAEIEAMRDGAAKRKAQREAELAEIRRNAKEKAASLSDNPQQAAQVEANARRVVAAKRRQWQREDEQLIREAAQRVQSAQDSARSAQIAAMAEGYEKEEALRREALDKLRRDINERVRLESDPNARAGLRSAGNQEIRALEEQQQRERENSLRESGQRIADAQRSARDAQIQALGEGIAKEEALRQAELDDLRADIAEKVRLAGGRPDVQAAEKQSGAEREAAMIRRQAQARADALEEGERTVQSAERRARDETIGAMREGYLKEAATRQAALEDRAADLSREINDFKGTESQRAALIRAANKEVLGLYQQQQRELRKIQEDSQRTVSEAGRSARSAEIAAIRDETQRTRASRDQELLDLQQQTREKLKTFQGTERQRQEIQDAARREQKAKQQQWANEDEASARESARRIAQVWQEVSNKQFAAQQAARDAALAGYNLDVSRRLGAVSGVNADPVVQARIEQEAAERRAQLAQQAADKQLAQEKVNLERSRDLALSADKLTAEDRRLIWAGYYADLTKLDADYQSGNRQRLQAQEEAARQAAESLRQARIQEAGKPVTRSENRQQELEQARAIALSDAEVLSLNRQISQERQTQIGLLQGQLDGVGDVVLSLEEREAVEARIRALQHEQTVAVREQEQAGRELVASTLSRLDAEAKLAESRARTDRELAAARQQQLAVTQARLRELDDQIAAEGREKERNALIEQRLGLLGQIDELRGKIDRAPLESERRRLGLYKEQARAELALRGLGEDKAAQAQLTVQIAARELLLANAQVAAARTQLELEAALSEQAGARLALVQALTEQQQLPAQTLASGGGDLGNPVADAIEKEIQARDEAAEAAQRQLDLENSLLDAAEARARALGQITGEAGDVVKVAELELQLSRDRLELVASQVGSAPDASTRAERLREQITLLGQVAEQERKLKEVQQARADLLEDLPRSEEALRAALAGGVTSGEAEATRKLTEARVALARAEREYSQARSEGNPERLKEATDGLTTAIQAQREAVRGLAAAYRQQVSEMDGVRGAGERLKAVAYGEGGQPFDMSRELDRLRAIEERRDVALREADRALESGETSRIRAAAEGLAREQERYKQQAKLLDERGLSGVYARTGEDDVRRIADQVDALGIQYDRESAALEERAQLADQEAQNALTLKQTAQQFDTTTQDLVKALEAAYADLRRVLPEAKREAETRQSLEREIARLRDRDGSGGGGLAAPPVQFAPITPEALNQMAAKLAAGIKLPEPSPPAFQPRDIPKFIEQAGEAFASHLGRLAVTYTPETHTPEVKQPVQHSYTLSVGAIHITAPSDRAPDIKRAAREALNDALSEARRQRGWGDGPC